MEIMKYSPTRSRTLENADDQNAIAVLPPKSHINFYWLLSTWTIDTLQLWPQEMDPFGFVQHSYGGPNVISRAIAFGKLLVPHMVRSPVLIRVATASMSNSSFDLRQPKTALRAKYAL